MSFECPSGEPTQQRPDSIKLQLGDVTRKAIELPKPEYPKEAKAAGIVGRITAEVVIDLQSGKVVWARIDKGHPLLQEAVKKVVCRARFPHTDDIGRIRGSGTVNYRFGVGKRVPPNKGMHRSAKREFHSNGQLPRAR